MAYAGKTNLPADTPQIGLEVRLIDGVPSIFTERGEHVKGQRGVTVCTRYDSVVTATLEFLPTRVEPNQ